MTAVTFAHEQLQSGLQDQETGDLPKRTPQFPRQGDSPESIVDIQETNTYTRANRRSTDLLAGVVQHPEMLRKVEKLRMRFSSWSFWVALIFMTALSCFICGSPHPVTGPSITRSVSTKSVPGLPMACNALRERQRIAPTSSRTARSREVAIRPTATNTLEI